MRVTKVLSLSLLTFTLGMLMPSPATASEAHSDPIDYVICLYQNQDPSRCTPPPPPNAASLISTIRNAAGMLCVPGTYPLEFFCILAEEEDLGRLVFRGRDYLVPSPPTQPMAKAFRECLMGTPLQEKPQRLECFAEGSSGQDIPDPR